MNASTAPFVIRHCHLPRPLSLSLSFSVPVLAACPSLFVPLSSSRCIPRRRISVHTITRVPPHEHRPLNHHGHRRDKERGLLNLLSLPLHSSPFPNLAIRQLPVVCLVFRL
ncbi:hypothetical protein F4823DRAFT_336824 [Ustulina deusta]|nr:hypothetical protein F4823DRAFT_336824 [Ustulina deusta]